MTKEPLSITYPEIAAQWHPTKNSITADSITEGSHYKAWWQCLKFSDHIWQTMVTVRINKLKKGGRVSCPFCSGQKIMNSTSIATTHPLIAIELHPTKNGGIDATQVTAGSSKKLWWKCAKGHEYETRVSHRIKGTGCPICAGKLESLAQHNPELIKEWHPLKNGKLTPSDVTAGSAKKVWWKCPNASDHEWQAVVHQRVAGSQCPFCVSRRTAESGSLFKTHFDLLKEWDYEKNKTISPKQVSAGSGQYAWWKCSKGHEWKTRINHRVAGRGCPYCSGLKPSPTYNLLFLNPELSKEWNYQKNGKLKPPDVTPGSSKKVWWLCKNNHEWQAEVNHRVDGRGCPFCNSGWTIEKIRLFLKSLYQNIEQFTPAELYVIFQQNGLLATDGRSKRFVKALVTGKFPKEELEKFINAEPSLVDDLINGQQSLEEVTESDNLQETEISESDIQDAASKDLPIIETKDILNSLDNPVISSADVEAIEFLITSGVAKIWNHAFLNEDTALRQAENFVGGEYPNQVKNRFIEQYKGSKELSIPNGYCFEQPNLMQRLAAYMVKTNKKVGNWSGTGAGKTLSAILSSRVIDAKLTVICCPNSVISGWKKRITETYPDSIVHIKTLTPKLDLTDNKHHYLILNYEAFQQENSEGLTKQLVDNSKIDFIVIDEIHYSKQRVVEDISKRKQIISGMISLASEKNQNLHILGMSATPVINNLYEGKTLLELITGIHYDDLQTTASVNNCMSLYQKLMTIGIRWMPKYEQKLNTKIIDVECSKYIGEIEKLGIKDGYVALEAILTKAKLSEIRKNIQPKTLIYTHYIKDILETLKEGVESDGWKVTFYTGDDKSGLDNFIDGDADVLIATGAVGTGVDGLQEVCNRLIINILPWTHAEFEQLKGRIYRQGQKKAEVDVIIPITYAEINDKRWSWCESKWKRIQFKKSIADAAVDGIVPEGHLRTPAQAYQDVMSWLKRLEEGKVNEIHRRTIHIPLSDTVIQNRIRKFGDFSKMNARINISASETTNKRFKNNPEEWELYHALYREERKDWSVVPYEEMISWCKKRPELVIGDFGCGEAKITEALENTVYSFDHVAINDKVIACDMSHVPLEDESLDVAIFSLSLMGLNFTDYIKESYRCLKLDGTLFIIEATSRFKDLDNFVKGLEKLGFDVFKPQQKYKFIEIKAVKNDRKVQDVVLEF